MGIGPAPPSFWFLLCYPIPRRSVDRRAFCLPPRGEDKARLGTVRAMCWGGCTFVPALFTSVVPHPMACVGVFNACSPPSS